MITTVTPGYVERRKDGLFIEHRIAEAENPLVGARNALLIEAGLGALLWAGITFLGWLVVLAACGVIAVVGPVMAWMVGRHNDGI